jgi:hypothetical protein
MDTLPELDAASVTGGAWHPGRMAADRGPTGLQVWLVRRGQDRCD